MSLITEPLMLNSTGVEIVNAINSIKRALVGDDGEGGESRPQVEEKAVNFYDYDGTRLYSYTAEEIAELTELPANPTHTGLVAQGWNWSLEQIQDYMEDYPTAVMTIGQMYDTDDGSTRFHVRTIDEYSHMQLVLDLTGTSGAVVDWGDESESNTSTFDPQVSGDMVVAYHSYSEPGEYTISVSMIDDSDTLVFGDMPNGLTAFGVDLTETYDDIVFFAPRLVTSVNIGSNVSDITAGFFFGCHNLETITMPNTVEVIEYGAFNMNLALIHICVPNSVVVILEYAFSTCVSLQTVSLSPSLEDDENKYEGGPGIGTGVFSYCSSLQSIAIPSNDGKILDVEYDLFLNCYSLRSITIPDSITSIGGFAFANIGRCPIITIPENVEFIGDDAFSSNVPNGYYKIIVKPTTPPTIQNGVFSLYAPSFVRIVVPDGCGEDYKADTNWSEYASMIEEESGGEEQTIEGGTRHGTD